MLTYVAVGPSAPFRGPVGFSIETVALRP